MESEKELFKKRLFEPALKAFNEIMRANSGTSGLPSFGEPNFDEWYDHIRQDIYIKDTDTIDNKRLYKLEQYGSLLFPQPTGGFMIQHPMNKDVMIEQYKKALGYTNSVLMVITEPFQKSFVEDSNSHFYQYFKDQSLGLYYTSQFKENYTILDKDVKQVIIPNTSLKVTVFTLEETQYHKTITIANWHGASAGDDPSQFKTVYDWALKSRVDYITGDSNITPKKSRTSMEEVIKQLNIPEYSVSQHEIQKDRWPDSILMNNQVDKKNLTPEIDGMFIVKVNRQTGGSLVAFETPYAKETPILADHNVVQLTVEGPPTFTLMAASAAQMDDPIKGILLKDTWEGVNLPEFHEKYDKPYTAAWRTIYKTFIDSDEGIRYKYVKPGAKPVNRPLPNTNPAISAVTGGRKRTTRKRRKTRAKGMKKSQSRRKGRSRTWSSSR